MEQKIGFNFIGHVSGNLGLGVHARIIIDMILARGYPLSIYDLDPGQERWRYDLTHEQYYVNETADLPHTINLFFLPPPTLSWFVLHEESYLRIPGRLNVAFSMWELPAIPDDWKPVMQFFDLIIAGSPFVRHAFEFSLPDTRVVSAETAMKLPEGVRVSPEEFGLETDSVNFVTSFEPHSDLIRKNAFAVVDAFLLAKRDAPDIRLIIKVNNPLHLGAEHLQLQELRRRIADQKEIKIITEKMSYARVLSLYASCDSFISLHRSEGFGLGLMEAMLLGKPVIATAWSGNMGFMNHQNSCLVGYKLIPVQGAVFQYQQKNFSSPIVWADARLHEASDWIVALSNSQQLRQHIGESARRSIIEYVEMAQKCQFISEIEAVWNQRHILSADTEKYSRSKFIDEMKLIQRKQRRKEKSLMRTIPRKLKKLLGLRK